MRIREDTAKYLLNRDVNSAHYDPKSRSLKEDPGAKNSSFKGDNYVKISGDYLNLIENEAFMIELNKRAEASGSTLMANTVAMPSHFEMLKKEMLKRKQEMAEMHKEQIKEKYARGPEGEPEGEKIKEIQVIED